MIDGRRRCFRQKRRLRFTTPLHRLPADVASAAAGVTRPRLTRAEFFACDSSSFVHRRRLTTNRVEQHEITHAKESSVPTDKRRHERLCLPFRPSEAFVLSCVSKRLWTKSFLSGATWANEERIIPPGPAAGGGTECVQAVESVQGFTQSTAWWSNRTNRYIESTS